MLGRAFLKEEAKLTEQAREALKAIAERANEDGYVDDDDLARAAEAVGLGEILEEEEGEAEGGGGAGGAAGVAMEVEVEQDVL